MLLCTCHIDKGGSLNRISWWIWVVVLFIILGAYIYVTVLS
jgi:hypothetical protein